jgi:glycosidase
MNFPQSILARTRPDSAPTDWRDEVIYFLLPDRFSDGGESDRPLVNPKEPGANRPAGFGWDDWAASGGGRFQGGTLNGITMGLA